MKEENCKLESKWQMLKAGKRRSKIPIKGVPEIKKVKEILKAICKGHFHKIKKKRYKL